MPRSTEKRRPGRPGPAPQIESAQRLEYLREKILEVDSLSDFWKQLDFDRETDGEDYVSYEAALTYHHNRPAPVKYLVRINEKFGVGLDWLATGRGDQPTPAPPDQDADDERWEILADAFPPFAYVERIQDAVVRAFEEWAWLEAARRDSLGDLSEKEIDKAESELARAIGDCLDYPFRQFEQSWDGYTIGQLEAYALHMSEAMIALVPKDYIGQRFYEIRAAGIGITAHQAAINMIARTKTEEHQSMLSQSRRYVQATNFSYNGHSIWLTAQQDKPGEGRHQWYIMIDGKRTARLREMRDEDREEPELLQREALAWLADNLGPEETTE